MVTEPVADLIPWQGRETDACRDRMGPVKIRVAFTLCSYHIRTQDDAYVLVHLQGDERRMSRNEFLYGLHTGAFAYNR